jgi:acetyl/propionyl-CoA carboxylase alpha subunit
VEELMRHSFTIAGIEHEVWLVRAGTGYALHIADKVVPAAIPHGATVAVDGDQVHIHLDGGTYTVQYTDPVARHARHGAGASDDLIEAPMPGVVIAVHVVEGQMVARGATLVVIESMKLETAIKAPRDGVIATVHVAVGKTFDRAASLVTLAPEAGA